MHVGTHILKGEVKRDLDKICGFCSRDLCAITIKISSKKKSKQYFVIVSGIASSFSIMVIQRSSTIKLTLEQ